MKLRAEVQKNGTYKVFIVDASDKNVETWLSKRNASPNGEPFDSSTILGSAQGQDSAINDYLAERKGFWIIYDRKRLPVELRYGSEDSFFQLTLQTKSEKGNTELKSLFWKRLKELQRGKSPIAAELKTITEENKIVVQR
ncbi:MAG: hypothetical protein JWQ35_990 [Bacteriovoracaceae bacterium]|nr:hypothetical protein [Bacteriovoracaceae bacterium]